MSKGDYLGGSTVVGPRSGWFSFKAQKKRQKSELKPALTPEQFEDKQKRRDNFFAMLQRTTKLSDNSARKRKRRKKRQ